MTGVLLTVRTRFFGALKSFFLRLFVPEDIILCLYWGHLQDDRKQIKETDHGIIFVSFFLFLQVEAEGHGSWAAEDSVPAKERQEGGREEERSGCRPEDCS